MKGPLLAGLIALTLTGVVPQDARAGEFAAIINGRSIHLDANVDYNESNTGLGIEYEFVSRSRWKKRLMVNGFRDSYDEMSYMVGGGVHRNLVTSERFGGFYFDAGINAFLMTRKDVNHERPFPGILPSLTVGNRYAGFNLTYLPVDAIEDFLDARIADESVSGIVFLQFKVSMNPRPAGQR